MRIDRKTQPKGRTLSDFSPGDCIRLVRDRVNNDLFVGNIYIVGSEVEDGRRVAINLSDGGHREGGLFMLEPSAKVVIE